jgi:peptide/nickel transport system substrate-binding protein
MVSAATVLSACSKPAETQNNTGSNTQAPTKQDANTPRDGGSLVIGAFSDIKTLNPLYVNDTASGDVANLLYASLYDWSRGFDLEVNERTIAAELPKVSADGLTYTIKIKTGMKWSDGKPLTIDDVLWTYQIIRTKEAGITGIDAFEDVKEIKKVDDTTFTITLNKIDARFIYNLNITPAPAHILKDVKPEELEKHAFGHDPKATVTSGPYVWKEYSPKQFNVVERNPNYWAKKANIQTITFKQYADQNTEIQALAAGEVDFVSGIPVATLPAIQGKPGIKIFEGLGQSYDYLMFNFKDSAFPQGKSPFKGAKTRQAIGHAINRKEMIDSVLQGHGVILNAPFLPSSFAYDNKFQGFAYDVEKAKQLLAEDGWKPGPDGILVKDGIKFEFDLITNTGNKRRESYIAIIQENLSKVGIKVNLKPTDFQAITGDITKKGQFQALLLGWSLTSPDPDKEGLFGSDKLPPGGQNYGSYSNKVVDQLWKDGYSTTDKAKRKEIYAKILEEMEKDPAYIYLGLQNILIGYKENKVKWADKDKPEPAVSYGAYYHIADWWVAE